MIHDICILNGGVKTNPHTQSLVRGLKFSIFHTPPCANCKLTMKLYLCPGLRCEDNYVTRYTNLLAVPHKQSLVRAHKRGALFGFSQAAQFFGWGITTYYGGYLVVTVILNSK